MTVRQTRPSGLHDDSAIAHGERIHRRLDDDNKTITTRQQTVWYVADGPMMSMMSMFVRRWFAINSYPGRLGGNGAGNLLD